MKFKERTEVVRRSSDTDTVGDSWLVLHIAVSLCLRQFIKRFQLRYARSSTVKKQSESWKEVVK
jgi:hypothetical protein